MSKRKKVSRVAATSDLSTGKYNREEKSDLNFDIRDERKYLRGRTAMYTDLWALSNNRLSAISRMARQSGQG